MIMNTELVQIVERYDPMELQFALFLEALMLRQPDDEYILEDYNLNHEEINYLNDFKKEITLVLQESNHELLEQLQSSSSDFNRFLFDLLPKRLY